MINATTIVLFHLDVHFCLLCLIFSNETTCLKLLTLHGCGIDLHMTPLPPPTSLVETVHSLPHDITALAHHAQATATPLVWTSSALDL